MTTHITCQDVLDALYELIDCEECDRRSGLIDAGSVPGPDTRPSRRRMRCVLASSPRSPACPSAGANRAAVTRDRVALRWLTRPGLPPVFR